MDKEIFHPQVSWSRFSPTLCICQMTHWTMPLDWHINIVYLNQKEKCQVYIVDNFIVDICRCYYCHHSRHGHGHLECCKCKVSRPPLRGENIAVWRQCAGRGPRGLPRVRGQWRALLFRPAQHRLDPAHRGLLHRWQTSKSLSKYLYLYLNA